MECGEKIRVLVLPNEDLTPRTGLDFGIMLVYIRDVTAGMTLAAEGGETGEVYLLSVKDNCGRFNP
ncbi:MAG: hypothetical protein Q8N08_05440 [Methanobacteriaceae archaeon]|nr:hypothetical protein [Methanobacteriaceae archaeon]